MRTNRNNNHKEISWMKIIQNHAQTQFKQRLYVSTAPSRSTRPKKRSCWQTSLTFVAAKCDKTSKSESFLLLYFVHQVQATHTLPCVVGMFILWQIKRLTSWAFVLAKPNSDVIKSRKTWLFLSSSFSSVKIVARAPQGRSEFPKQSSTNAPSQIPKADPPSPTTEHFLIWKGYRKPTA